MNLQSRGHLVGFADDSRRDHVSGYQHLSEDKETTYIRQGRHSDVIGETTINVKKGS